jgi:hypothetical protein
MSYLNKFLEQFEEKKEEIKPIGETLMGFGKHKGKTYDFIYKTDKSYVKWVVTNKDEKYIKKIKAYFLQKIEEDFNMD